MSQPNLRQWSGIRQSLVATHIAGFVAYYQLGVIIHRSSFKWDRQNIILPLTFLFFPLLDYQGLNFYVCGVLGMYAKRISFRDADQNWDNTAERLGGGLLLDVFRPRAQFRQRHWSEVRWFNVLMLILTLYQTTSTSILYIRRWLMGGQEFLAIDHRTGLMAIGALSASLGNVFFEATGFDWVDTLCTANGPKLLDYPHGTLHVFQGEVNLSNSLDVTNKHVFDIALAVCAHLIQLRFAGRHFPLFIRRNDSTEPPSLLLSLVPYVATVLMSIPIIGRSFWSFWLRGVWLPGSGKISRAVLIPAIVYIAAATICTEAVEIADVLHHGPSALNGNWMWKDPWNDFLWSL